MLRPLTNPSSTSLQVVVSGVLRGSGMQSVGAAVMVMSHMVVGLPLALWLGFTRKMGVLGLCTGTPGVGLCCSYCMHILNALAVHKYFLHHMHSCNAVFKFFVGLVATYFVSASFWA